jgi:hypothetical protein
MSVVFKFMSDRTNYGFFVRRLLPPEDPEEPELCVPEPLFPEEPEGLETLPPPDERLGGGV